MENITALCLEDYFKQLIHMEPHKTIARITQYLLNIIMLRERDFFLKAMIQKKIRQTDFMEETLPACSTT